MICDLVHLVLEILWYSLIFQGKLIPELIELLSALMSCLQEDMKQMPQVSTFLKSVLNYHTTMPTEKEVEKSKKHVSSFYVNHLRFCHKAYFSG